MSGKMQTRLVTDHDELYVDGELCLVAATRIAFVRYHLGDGNFDVVPIIIDHVTQTLTPIGGSNELELYRALVNFFIQELGENLAVPTGKIINLGEAPLPS